MSAHLHEQYCGGLALMDISCVGKPLGNADLGTPSHSSSYLCLQGPFQSPNPDTASTTVPHSAHNGVSGM
eukprot:CAMPEP_0180503398 /NCGR_PEP_ID=MMETSP1036_2-20121128/46016_1 /TAXON_ID=632150 /ORGANISM="Azadinium spinosum, Strain 3D9" /LENGTH=69 /DNA_ID=CAMNT_0022512433 /DNA_START=363 /DNA_END=572 /DNA_ORIENTATION=+